MRNIFTFVLFLFVSLYAEPEVIHGHTLPPEPDPKINSATLLGVDVNKNGVRDDVERWIYKTYKDKYLIYIDIAMQSGRAWQKVMEDPAKAKEIYFTVDNVTWCEGYFAVYAKYFNKPILITEERDINGIVIYSKVVNTSRRKQAYEQYDSLLSGATYSTPKIDKNLTSYCDFNTSKYEK